MIMMVQESVQQHLADKEEQIRQLAYRDELTQLPNRRLLLDQLEHLIGLQARIGGYVGLMFIDLDKFKDLNDSLGHKAGDELLIQVANRLREVVRKSDTVARFGGDEFVVLLHILEPDPERARNHARAIAEKVRHNICIPYRLSWVGNANGHEYALSASIGVLLQEKAGSIQELLERADGAMYQAKNSGRDRIVYADQVTAP
jgi:diguanylate cyclase (GGDEF)-like protein